MLPLTNIIPETAAQLILKYLGFNTDKSHINKCKRKCIAFSQCTKQSPIMKNCKRRATKDSYFCHQHYFIYNTNTRNYTNSYLEWKLSIYTLARLLHGHRHRYRHRQRQGKANINQFKLRKFKEPSRCFRCQLTYHNCKCPCFCIKCTPARHLHIVEYTEGWFGEMRSIISAPCVRSGINKNNPYNHKSCEYCIAGRKCHNEIKIEYKDDNIVL